MVDYNSLPHRDELNCNLCDRIGNFININNNEYCLDGCVYCCMRGWGAWGLNDDGTQRYSNGCKENGGVYSNQELVHFYLKNALMLNKSVNSVLNRTQTIYPHRNILSSPPNHTRDDILFIVGNNMERKIGLNDVFIAFNNLNNNDRYSESEIFGFDLEKYIDNNENEINEIRNNIDWNNHYPGLRTRELLDIN